VADNNHTVYILPLVDQIIRMIHRLTIVLFDSSMMNEMDDPLPVRRTPP
jgi:hypothetical protein